MRQVTLRDVPMAQLMCMRGGFNHPFEPIAKPVKTSRWHRRIVSLCGRCGKERTQLRDVYDRSVTTYYKAPDWHVQVTVAFDATDVAEELSRRLAKGLEEPSNVVPIRRRRRA